MAGEPDGGAWPELVTRSYTDVVGGILAARADLYRLDAVVLAHDAAPDPLLVYVNLAAQDLWERDWHGFVGVPSRLTAPPEARSERATALASGAVVRGYEGVRVSASGRRFRIECPVKEIP